MTAKPLRRLKTSATYSLPDGVISLKHAPNGAGPLALLPTLVAEDGVLRLYLPSDEQAAYGVILEFDPDTADRLAKAFASAARAGR